MADSSIESKKRKREDNLSEQSPKKIKLENLNVGTIGHVDHGKTTLTSALTYVTAKKK